MQSTDPHFARASGNQPIRRLCKRILRGCSICQRHNAVPFKYPNMGPLPAERVTQSPPFSFRGVDLMGPLTIKNDRSEDEKRYVTLFTCLVIRMVHLEVAIDLSTRSFLLVFKRFVSRRGVPLKTISDNGTNFHLAETVLRQNEPSQCSEFSFFLAKHDIQWSFIPTASPWMGGAWERMIGTVKRALLKTIRRRKVPEEILATVLCEVESAVNSRPLTLIGGHDGMNDVLRPVNFIYKNIHHGMEVIPSGEQCYEDPVYKPTPEIATQSDAKKAIAEVEKLTAKFWDKWKTECLIELRDRHVLCGTSYKSSKQSPRIGDVVLIDDDLQTSKDHWRMDLIQDLVTSKDGEIRSALLRAGTGRCIQRPLNRLIPLEIHSTMTTPEASSSVQDPTKSQKKPSTPHERERPLLEQKQRSQ
ncbi:integrase core domain protein [Oesophagostomum dentatum]|uniref:Integrase core domain protein n=1 Tax=Oesophagostomum dentatum TaxID=61180 RepID=A0A0B1TS79_OESDE|nr:integrase core domain protein [Oesophagostomum dentatum]